MDEITARQDLTDGADNSDSFIKGTFLSAQPYRKRKSLTPLREVVSTPASPNRFSPKAPTPESNSPLVHKNQKKANVAIEPSTIEPDTNHSINTPDSSVTPSISEVSKSLMEQLDEVFVLNRPSSSSSVNELFEDQDKLPAILTDPNVTKEERDIYRQRCWEKKKQTLCDSVARQIVKPRKRSVRELASKAAKKGAIPYEEFLNDLSEDNTTPADAGTLETSQLQEESALPVIDNFDSNPLPARSPKKVKIVANTVAATEHSHSPADTSNIANDTLNGILNPPRPGPVPTPKPDIVAAQPKTKKRKTLSPAGKLNYVLGILSAHKENPRVMKNEIREKIFKYLIEVFGQPTCVNLPHPNSSISNAENTIPQVAENSEAINTINTTMTHLNESIRSLGTLEDKIKAHVAAELTTSKENLNTLMTTLLNDHSDTVDKKISESISSNNVNDEESPNKEDLTTLSEKIEESANQVLALKEEFKKYKLHQVKSQDSLNTRMKNVFPYVYVLAVQLTDTNLLHNAFRALPSETVSFFMEWERVSYSDAALSSKPVGKLLKHIICLKSKEPRLKISSLIRTFNTQAENLLHFLLFPSTLSRASLVIVLSELYMLFIMIWSQASQEIEHCRSVNIIFDFLNQLSDEEQTQITVGGAVSLIEEIVPLAWKGLNVGSVPVDENGHCWYANELLPEQGWKTNNLSRDDANRFGTLRPVESLPLCPNPSGRANVNDEVLSDKEDGEVLSNFDEEDFSLGLTQVEVPLLEFFASYKRKPNKSTPVDANEYEYLSEDQRELNEYLDQDDNYNYDDLLQL